MIITIDEVPGRLELFKKIGRLYMINFKEKDVIEELMRLIDNRGVDAVIEALGTQTTFEQALQVLPPGGGMISSLGVYSTDLKILLGTFGIGLAEKKIIISL
ncbi:MAG: zinc-binding dehydrogenase [Flavobacteriales bacterium AspAUS03]